MSVLLEGRNNANIHASSGVAWEIAVYSRCPIVGDLVPALLATPRCPRDSVGGSHADNEEFRKKMPGLLIVSGSGNYSLMNAAS
jgi:hypothetical protein